MHLSQHFLEVTLKDWFLINIFHSPPYLVHDISYLFRCTDETPRIGNVTNLRNPSAPLVFYFSVFTIFIFAKNRFVEWLYSLRDRIATNIIGKNSFFFSCLCASPERYKFHSYDSVCGLDILPLPCSYILCGMDNIPKVPSFFGGTGQEFLS